MQDEKYFRETQPELIEMLAQEIHNKAIHDITTIDGFQDTKKDFVNYSDLSDKIKEINRQWAAKYLRIIFVQTLGDNKNVQEIKKQELAIAG